MNPKQKGNNFEREIAKKLSRWITNDERDDILDRSHGSGLKSTVTGSPVQAGDICAVHKLGFPFVNKYIVECKNRRDYRLQDLIYWRERSRIIKDWRKLLRECKNFNRIPLFIIKNFRCPTLLGTNKFLPKLDEMAEIFGSKSSEDILLYDFEMFLKIEPKKVIK